MKGPKLLWQVNMQSATPNTGYYNVKQSLLFIEGRV